MTGTDADNEARYHVCVVKGDPCEMVAPKQAIVDDLHRHRFSDEAVFAVKLALEEALCNAVKHGNKGDTRKDVLIRYLVTSEKCEVIVRDEGRGFEPELVPDPTAPDRLPLPSGRGIMLIKAYMDDVEYRENGREVYFVRHRKSKV